MANLPSGYVLQEYISSNGMQYIDTGLYAKSTTKVVIDCEITYSSSWTMIFGSYDTGKYFSWWTDGATIYAYYGSAYKTAVGPTGRITLTADKTKWTAGNTAFTFSSSSFTASSKMLIFRVNNGGSYDNATMKLYSCQIYDNGKLVRDFVPCKDSSGVAGLYDVVNSKFYKNAGTGNFGTPPIHYDVDTTGITAQAVRLLNIRELIAAAISDMGVSVPSGKKYDALAAYIKQITGKTGTIYETTYTLSSSSAMHSSTVRIPWSQSSVPNLLLIRNSSWSFDVIVEKYATEFDRIYGNMNGTVDQYSSGYLMKISSGYLYFAMTESYTTALSMPAGTYTITGIYFK